MRIKYVGFSALWGDEADFRIWNFNEEAGFSQVLELGLPHGVVPGSASGNLLISGGLHLPLYNFQNEDQLSDVWRDSQISAATADLAPLLALEHIPHLVEANERERILKKLPEQVQILLSFRKSDNSFSDHPSVTSHLSTIKILEILYKIQSYYPIDPNLLQSTKTWVQKRQNPDGSFTPLSADKEVDYFPVEINTNSTEKEIDVNEYYYYERDGNMTEDEVEWERTVEVTAETLTALLEIGVENQVDADVAKRAQKYLEKNFYNLTSPASLAASVLALVMARSPLVPEALEILKNASTTEEGEFGWPAPRRDAADWLLEENSRNIKTTSYEAVTLEQYVAGVRVLLAAAARGALAAGEDAARFLYYRAAALRRHPALAFRATLAAARYASLAYDRHRALTVSLATAGMELTDTLELRARSPPRALALPGLPTKVFVYATGAGCATVQGTISYSTYVPKPENSLLNVQAAIIEEIRPERSSIEDLQGNLPTLIIKTCFKWKGKNRSGILRLEASLFSGYELRSVNPVVLDGATFADLHYGSRGESVWFVFNNISSTCPVCVTFEARSKFVITSLRPAFAKIYPSTRPDLAVETFFHARPGSPLLKGITDDDFITWFDKTQLASLKTSTNIDNICECGRICSRDYEFRKDYEKIHLKIPDTNTSTVSSTDAVNSTEKQEVASTETNNIDVTATTLLDISTTTTSNLNSIATNPTTDVVTEVTTKEANAIIIPTVTYSNNTDNQNIDNTIQPLPKVNGDLIIQKVPVNKSILKKSDGYKKPLPRRKGTLKATYGDKHEKFFSKSKLVNIIKTENNTESNNSTANIKPKVYNQPITSNETAVTKELPVKKEPLIIKKSLINKEPTIHTETSLKPNVVITTTEATKSTAFDTSTVTTEKNDVQTTKSSIAETTIIPHTITTITKSNIKTMHYRTKKPKPKTQIKKPDINVNKTNDQTLTNTNTTSDTNNKSNKVIEKYVSKSLKSINKEIHKMPPNPISETDLDKSLNNPIKIDIAPENKGGFEILDKNNIWELLKDPNNSKIDIQNDKSMSQNNRSL